MSDAEIMSTAAISDCGTYRYQLTRAWAPGPCDVWIMLNPSTADAEIDDPTIRRCVGFSRGWGSGSLVVVNLFALRATDPEALVRHPDPIGPENDRHIELAAAGAHHHGGRVIAAWGAHRMAEYRAWDVHRVVRRQGPLVALGVTKQGAPRHPLYVKGDASLQPWRPR